jgi:endonuclease/exonuclease/phosphatase (EEP) superfamily protein YafD
VNSYPSPGRAEGGNATTNGRGALTVVSYNLWQGRAQHELASLAATESPDLLCLQEAAVEALPSRLGHLRLVASTTGVRLGVALYADEGRFTIEESAPFSVVRSLHDRIRRSTAQRLVGARLRDLQSNETLVAGSLHATPLTDPNFVRRRQIDEALGKLRTFGDDLPTVLAGDFNYPFRTHGLARHLARGGYQLSRSSTSTYRHRGLVRGAFDLAASRHVTMLGATTLPQGASDHMPIRVAFRYEDPTR